MYQRVWDFGTQSQQVTVDRFDANTFGFYALNGADAVEVRPNSRTESVCAFCGRSETRTEGPLVEILDNYPSHKATEVRELSRDLGIQLAFLPECSPFLNPIVSVWKELRYVLSRIFVIDEEARFQTLIQQAFADLSTKLSYAEDWIEKFLTDFKKLRRWLCTISSVSVSLWFRSFEVVVLYP